jgi:hypothetical protein
MGNGIESGADRVAGAGGALVARADDPGYPTRLQAGAILKPVSGDHTRPGFDERAFGVASLRPNRQQVVAVVAV